MEETEEDINKRYPIFMDQQNQYFLNVHTTQILHLYIQCNTYQNFNVSFHMKTKNNIKICMELQKTPNSSNNPEKEESWRQLAS